MGFFKFWLVMGALGIITVGGIAVEVIIKLAEHWIGSLF